MFTPAELDRARARTWDPRIADALEQAGSYGIAEYLAAGPTLLQIWENARASSRGPHARGAALVAAAIDIRRAGWTSLLPRDLLTQAHEHYLTDPEHARTPREPLDEAWDWATRQREATTALLRPDPADPGQVEAFDYLIDTIQRRDGPLAHVPEPTIRAAISHATPADADSIANVAYAQGRYQLAEHGLAAGLRGTGRPRPRRRAPRHPDQPQQPRPRPGRPGAAGGGRGRAPRRPGQPRPGSSAPSTPTP